MKTLALPAALALATGLCADTPRPPAPPKPAPHQCQPYALHCPACKDCSKCRWCNSGQGSCSVKRATEAARYDRAHPQ